MWAIWFERWWVELWLVAGGDFGFGVVGVVVGCLGCEFGLVSHEHGGVQRAGVWAKDIVRAMKLVWARIYVGATASGRGPIADQRAIRNVRTKVEERGPSADHKCREVH